MSYKKIFEKPVFSTIDKFSIVVQIFEVIWPCLEEYMALSKGKGNYFLSIILRAPLAPPPTDRKG
jgi:hypothetical protein